MEQLIEEYGGAVVLFLVGISSIGVLQTLLHCF